MSDEQARTMVELEKLITGICGGLVYFSSGDQGPPQSWYVQNGDLEIAELAGQFGRYAELFAGAHEITQQLIDAKGLIRRMDQLLREMDIDEGLEVDSVTKLLAEADKAAE